MHGAFPAIGGASGVKIWHPPRTGMKGSEEGIGRKCSLESVHYIGKICTSEYPYGRGERRHVINTKESVVN
jgi:hypothetical protein